MAGQPRPSPESNGPSPSSHEASDSRRNIVLVVTDDHGPWANPRTMPELVMPHLATLMDDGVEFTRAFCASPVCSPSRASMITGRMPSAHGVHDWIIGTVHPDAHADAYLHGQTTISEVLAGHGYDCAMIGKWHLGDARHPAPGYRTWYAHRRGGGPYVGAPIWKDGHAATEPRHFTEAVGEEAVRFLREEAGQGPFFLHVNFTAPHDPWFGQHPARLTDLYADTTFPSVPIEDQHPWFAPRHADFREAVADRRGALTGYCASLTGVDEQLGAIRSALTDRSLADDTVIMFVSDNGFSAGHHGIWGKGNGTVPTNFWRNSVQVPFVLADPSGPAGTRCEAPWSTAGIFDTICEIARVGRPHDPYAVGESAYVAAAGRATTPTLAILDEYGGRMLRLDRWCYVDRPDGPRELYDVEADPDERYNLVDDPAHADRAGHLHERLTQAFARLERPGYCAYHRPITGRGQIHPLWRQYANRYTYAPQEPPSA